MSPIKACIFDLDGVIVDTTHFHYLAWKRLTNELGFDITEEDNEQLKGVSRMECLRIILSIGGVSTSADKLYDLAEMKNRWYLEHIYTMTEQNVIAGAVEFIDAVQKAGLKVAIASASKNAGIILDKLNLRDRFSVLVDGNVVNKSKPNPEIFLRSARELGVEPDSCIVFEDAISGIQAANNAGMRSVGIGSDDMLKNAHLVVPTLGAMSLEDLFSLENFA
ncbi:beta-phosphoglucomutase [Solitalea sp. MAHUQ-68]|uniref:Beta-phosphoglucomutase n=1 Tax=Solitalea agri TaxID=2953739 RepID=A0A9X2F3C2_9SPHI|nr:beta-phosphoglucomutase [Solitalea agri]MCO4293892.1 beta-phosphoglucomutase [Solitalea agri]